MACHACLKTRIRIKMIGRGIVCTVRIKLCICKPYFTVVAWVATLFAADWLIPPIALAK